MMKVLLSLVIFFSPIVWSAESSFEEITYSKLLYRGDDPQKYPAYYLHICADNYDSTYYPFISNKINHTLKSLLLKDDALYKKALTIHQNPHWCSHINGNWGTCLLLGQFDSLLKPYQKSFSHNDNKEMVINAAVMSQLERQHLIRQINAVMNRVIDQINQKYLVSRLQMITTKFPDAFSKWDIITCNEQGNSLVKDAAKMKLLNNYFIETKAISPQDPLTKDDIGPIMCRGLNKIIKMKQQKIDKRKKYSL